jgi:Fic family protein
MERSRLSEYPRRTKEGIAMESMRHLDIEHARAPYDALVGDARDQFFDELTRTWLFHDRALEGVVLEEGDIEQALAGKPGRNFVDNQQKVQIRRLRDAIDFIRREARERRELSIEWIRDLHRRMCDDDEEAAGAWRERNTSPGVYNLNIVEADELPGALEDVLATYRDESETMHAIPAAAQIHWDFMRAFPFDDRTGVVGRLLLNFMLMREDYPPALFHQQERHSYFQALRAHRHDLVPVVIDGIEWTIEAADEFEVE